MYWKLSAAALLFAGFALPAGDPPGFSHWKSADLKAFGKTLAPKMNSQKLATQSLPAMGNYSFVVAHREAPGEAEWHETAADIFVVQSGEATLVYGGKMVDAKTTAPNEQRGPSISGGMETRLAPGDIVAIPARTPHQVKAENGKPFTYFVIKLPQ
jgi:mannose-6-phosphate isomerase-like protein (cupin superfamily)